MKPVESSHAASAALLQELSMSWKITAEGGAHLDLRGAELPAIEEIDEACIARLARIVRGLAFTAVDAAKSGHPGGSSSKAEMVAALLASGLLAFDPARPKHPGRDRVIWSAGHCSPLFHALVALVYECQRRAGFVPEDEARSAVEYPEDLARFRRYGGPGGHVESHLALADASTGSSGHGFSMGLGAAALLRSCGLESRAWVIAGDAETEEGMSYEARNLAASLGLDNVVVILDYNHFGIDGPITEVLPAPYLSHWSSFGWNVIEAGGDNVRELVHAYGAATRGFGNGRPTVVLCHTVKGRFYGRLEGSADSHGTPLPRAEYAELMHALGFQVGAEGGQPLVDLSEVTSELSPHDAQYLNTRLEAAAARIPAEADLTARMQAALPGQVMADYRTIRRPETLPPELVFAPGDLVPTRKATEAWFAWMMRQTPFFYVGAGDLAKSILTIKAEQVHGLLSRANPTGRGIRFGIAEQNMAMMCVAMAGETLPGGYRPMTAFASYGVFSVMMANAVRMGLINADVNAAAKPFFILLAAHDGPETGEDGPTHHGLFWMSLYSAYPGIKVYKPLDANETVEMLFHAAERGEPVVLSVVRPNVPVFARGNGVPEARAALDGAYVFKNYAGNGKRRLPVAVCSGQMLQNLLTALPELERKADVKVIAVTSPELFEELRQRDPGKARAVLSDEERASLFAFHNGWPGFLYPFLLPADYTSRCHGIDRFQRSGSPKEIYAAAGFDPAGIAEKISSHLSAAGA